MPASIGSSITNKPLPGPAVMPLLGPAGSSSAVASFHTSNHDDNLADLEFTVDEVATGSRNPLLLLSAAARQLNPRQFDLPQDVTCPVNFPGIYCYYTLNQKMPTFLYFTSCYKCRLISIMFGTQYAEIIFETRVIDFSASPEYCCCTTMGKYEPRTDNCKNEGCRLLLHRLRIPSFSTTKT